jgi:steroid 5-alpha reductase family enzyme
MLKQNIWLLFLSNDPMPVGPSLAVCAYNTFCNSLNDYLFLCIATSAALSSSSQYPQLPLIIGGTMYAVGIVTELVAEMQRSAFKKNPQNKGKAYTGGLWQLARHVNYTGYSL